MSLRWRSIFAVIVIAAGVALGGAAHLSANHGSKGADGNAKGQRRQDRARNGDYATMVAGNFRGSGSAIVQDDTVSLQASVVDDSGQTQQLQAPNLAVDGPYFAGTGTLGDKTLTIRGRIDASRASRLTATFIDSDGHGGRIVGKLPASVDPPDDQWDKEHPGQGQGPHSPARTPRHGAH